MEPKPLYSAIANNNSLRNYLKTKKLRKLMSRTASASSVLLLARKDRDLTDKLLLEGVREGIERHLLDILHLSDIPSKKATLYHLADNESFSRRIYDCTSQKLTLNPKYTLDEFIYGNALIELSTLSSLVATHYHNHVMENYARRSVKK